MSGVNNFHQGNMPFGPPHLPQNIPQPQMQGAPGHGAIHDDHEGAPLIPPGNQHAVQTNTMRNGQDAAPAIKGSIEKRAGAMDKISGAMSKLAKSIDWKTAGLAGGGLGLVGAGAIVFVVSIAVAVASHGAAVPVLLITIPVAFSMAAVGVAAIGVGLKHGYDNYKELGKKDTKDSAVQQTNKDAGEIERDDSHDEIQDGEGNNRELFEDPNNVQQNPPDEGNVGHADNRAHNVIPPNPFHGGGGGGVQPLPAEIPGAEHRGTLRHVLPRESLNPQENPDQLEDVGGPPNYPPPPPPIDLGEPQILSSAIPRQNLEPPIPPPKPRQLEEAPNLAPPHQPEAEVGENIEIKEVKPDAEKMQKTRSQFTLVTEEMVKASTDHFNSLELISSTNGPLSANFTAPAGGQTWNQVLQKESPQNQFLMNQVGSTLKVLTQLEQTLATRFDEVVKEPDLKKRAQMTEQIFTSNTFKRFTQESVRYNYLFSQLDKSSSTSQPKMTLSAVLNGIQVRKKESMQDSTPSGLGDYLIKPTQRGGKHPLLLREMIGNASKLDDQEMVQQLTAAQSSAEQVMSLSNQLNTISDDYAKATIKPLKSAKSKPPVATKEILKNIALGSSPGYQSIGTIAPKLVGHLKLFNQDNVMVLQELMGAAGQDVPAKFSQAKQNILEYAISYTQKNDASAVHEDLMKLADQAKLDPDPKIVAQGNKLADILNGGSQNDLSTLFQNVGRIAVNLDLDQTT